MTADGTVGGLDEVAAARRGRFRVTSSSSGPPETTLGRFRLVPQSGKLLNIHYLYFPFRKTQNMANVQFCGSRTNASIG